MRCKITIRIIFLWYAALGAQDRTRITGEVKQQTTQDYIIGAKVHVEGAEISSKTDSLGRFLLHTTIEGEHVLHVSKEGFEPKRIPVVLEGNDLAIGIVYLDPDLTIEKTINLINLTQDELLDDETNSSGLALLQATRDIFLNRAAFDFGQAFYRVRGYDSQYGEVLLNGLPMNKMINGRPQWNNWGGLNDVVRNQQYANGLSASDFTFGGILGNTNINLRPSGLRAGTRLSSSVSNRTYAGRLMATHTSKLIGNRWAYTVSASKRWAKEGYIEGTLYDAYSAYGSLEYQLNTQNSISATAILASNRRGRSSAITEEVFRLKGNQYNPYWGIQNGNIRNSRTRSIQEPLFLLDYTLDTENIKITAVLGYQTGSTENSRLGYYNAPNPDPTYYRYLPSFYINSPIGANFESAQTARDGFIENAQIDWMRLYAANRSTSQNGKAAYVLYNDVVQDHQLSGRLYTNIILGKTLRWDTGFTYKRLTSNNFARIKDLLGASFHEDIDPFSETKNDINTTVQKNKHDIFNYKYQLLGNHTALSTQIHYNKNRLRAFLAGKYDRKQYQRNGLFKNERFLDNSFGESEQQTFMNGSAKAGLTYSLTGRHWLSIHAGFIQKAPLLQNVFINPRESNALVPQLTNEKIRTLDANYFIRMPKLTGRFTGYYTKFQDQTDVNFFFVDAGVGSDFVQEVITDIDKLHMGLEIGLEYQVSSAVKLTWVSSTAKHVYANNPLVTINFDTAGANEELIDISGSKELGRAAIEGYRLAQGPQTALAFGIAYRDPHYWWLGTTANYLANTYANIATILRTESFSTNPETGAPFVDATPENIGRLLAQKPLDNYYLLNLVGGKSWLKKGKYLSAFISVNNVFDTVFRTGGYEQSRNGNYGQMKEDNLSGNPSFAPKYWYGFGRTYFLNVAYSF